MHQVVLFSRPGCHLCDLARDEIEAVRARHGFDFVEVDIGSDDRLVRDYGLRIPVVSVDGEEVFEIEVDASRLAALVNS